MKVILYSNGCRRCRTIEQMLKQAGINYSLCTNRDKMIALGFEDAPHLQVNETIMNYVEAFKWIYNNYLR